MFLWEQISYGHLIGFVHIYFLSSDVWLGGWHAEFVKVWLVIIYTWVKPFFNFHFSINVIILAVLHKVRGMQHWYRSCMTLAIVVLF